MITLDQLRRFAPTAKAELIAGIVRNWPAAERVGITTPLRTQHFLAQIATETGGFRLLEESLNYSVDGLLKTFGRHRISEADARRLGREKGRPADQQAIGNIIYGGDFGRAQLGNTESGDGYRYRGGGYIQTTGRASYRRAGYEDNPEALRDPDAGFHAALLYWTDRGCNTITDTDDVTVLRKRINGGTNGLAEAKRYTALAKEVWVTADDLRHAPILRPQPQRPPLPPPPDIEPVEPRPPSTGNSPNLGGAAAGVTAVVAAGVAGLWWLVVVFFVATVVFLTRKSWLRLFRKRP